MHEGMLERAREVGRMLGQTPEYQALKRAQDRMSDDREVVALVNRLAELEGTAAVAIRAGQEPSPEVREEYEQVFVKLQESPIYQSLIAAQSNFDKVLERVNAEMATGIESGAQSRIILPS